MEESNLSVLPAHENMTVEEALSMALNENRAGETTDVLILSYTNDGVLRIRSSNMSRAEANWMLDQAKQDTLDISGS